MKNDEILTAHQVADLLNLHLKTVYQLANNGEIPASRIGRSWRFSRSAIEALVGVPDKKASDQ